MCGFPYDLEPIVDRGSLYLRDRETTLIHYIGDYEELLRDPVGGVRVLARFLLSDLDQRTWGS